MGREEGKKMRSELALAGDSPYAYIYTCIYIHLHCCSLVVSGSDYKTVRLWDAEIGTVRLTPEGHLNYLPSVLTSRTPSFAYSRSPNEEP
jgi:hypothetical protein